MSMEKELIPTLIRFERLRHCWPWLKQNDMVTVSVGSCLLTNSRQYLSCSTHRYHAVATARLLTMLLGSSRRSLCPV